MHTQAVILELSICHPEPVEGRIEGIFAFLSAKFKDLYSKSLTGCPSTGSG